MPKRPIASAYGRELDPFVLTRALATFQRSLLSGNSPVGPAGNATRPPSASLTSRAALTLFGAGGLGM